MVEMLLHRPNLILERHPWFPSLPASGSCHYLKQVWEWKSYVVTSFEVFTGMDSRIHQLFNKSIWSNKPQLQKLVIKFGTKEKQAKPNEL